MNETVVAYHGTSERLARQIEQDGFEQSAAAGDWLGQSIYFWQDSLKLGQGVGGGP